MACSTPTVHWAGVSFSSAAQLYSDSALTTVAADGWYSFGGVAREMSGGVLGPVQVCSTCVVPCGDPIAVNKNAGLYTIQLDMGNTPGAAIITFSPGKSSTNRWPVPDYCNWEYNGITASECTSLVGGYMTGMIGAPDGPPNAFTNCNSNTATGIPVLSTNPGYSYTFNSATLAFDQAPGSTPINQLCGGGAITGNPGPAGFTGIQNNTGVFQSTLLDWNCTAQGQDFCDTGTALNIPPSPYNNALPIAPNLPRPLGTPWPYGGLEYRSSIMVVPSPPGVANNILTITVQAPCGGTWWGIDIRCPEQLPPIGSSPGVYILNSSERIGNEPPGVLNVATTPLTSISPAALTKTFYHAGADQYGANNGNSDYHQAGSTYPGNVANGQPPGVLGLHDWIFEDENGVTPVPVGVYKMRFPPNAGGIPQDWAVEVGFREYADLDIGGHALPPEGYVGAGPTQSTGARIPGIVKSITPL